MLIFCQLYSCALKSSEDWTVLVTNYDDYENKKIERKDFQVNKFIAVAAETTTLRGTPSSHCHATNVNRHIEYQIITTFNDTYG